MIVVFLFLLGLCIGSFLNVIVDRLSKDESIVFGRSYCDTCKKKLNFFDLIPVLSFAWLKGKCRYCNSSISYQYPLVELGTGILFVITYILFNSNIVVMQSGPIYFISLFYYLLIVSSLIIIFLTDLKYGIILDKILIFAVFAVVLYLFLFSINNIIPHFISGLASFLLFLSLFVITKGKGMGFGDVKFSFLMGFLLGFPGIIISLYIAFILGAIISLLLILFKRKKFSKDTIPFGPFLVLGTLSALFWGNFFYSYFLKFLGI